MTITTDTGPATAKVVKEVRFNRKRSPWPYTQPKNEEEELLLRVFSQLKKSHFGDHKMSVDYCNSVRFNRGLGEQVAALVEKRFPSYYHAAREKFEKEASTPSVPSCGSEGRLNVAMEITSHSVEANTRRLTEPWTESIEPSK